jgi:large subunit ribosomal protein L29
MKAKEVQDLSLSEIEKKLRDTREELLQMRLRKVTGQIERSHMLRELRRDVARLETFRSVRQKSAKAS